MRITTLTLLTISLACWSSCQTSDTPEGGYPYIPVITAEDSTFYFLPVRDSFNTSDSFYMAFTSIQFKGFDEPNLSLRPMALPVYRFCYEGFSQHSVYISLLPQKIIIKEGSQATVQEVDPDLRNLSAMEKMHYSLLQRRFPLNDTIHSAFARKHLDSMILLYPQLLDPKYYAGLLRKILQPTDPPFSYSTKTIDITQEKYEQLIQGFDRAGYWSLPPQLKCKASMADGFGFSLEANTPAKYNFVNVYACPGDSSAFTQACQDLVDAAGLQLKLKVDWK